MSYKALGSWTTLLNDLSLCLYNISNKLSFCSLISSNELSFYFVKCCIFETALFTFVFHNTSKEIFFTLINFTPI